uniref:Ixodegrin B n=1 Tax=Rhipicephalus zambeziensis TaxID=60191 RepID=A0A224YM69_9ACAR
MAFLRIVVNSVALYLCLTSAAVVEKRDVNTDAKGKVGSSCDGNDECGPELCCFRPNVTAGTVCGNLGEASQSCSNVTLEEHSPTQNANEPSCREDEEAEGTTAKPYSPPYNGACPCKTGLVCDFGEKNRKQRD